MRDLQDWTKEDWTAVHAWAEAFDRQVNLSWYVYSRQLKGLRRPLCFVHPMMRHTLKLRG